MALSAQMTTPSAQAVTCSCARRDPVRFRGATGLCQPPWPRNAVLAPERAPLDVAARALGHEVLGVTAFVGGQSVGRHCMP